MAKQTYYKQCRLQKPTERGVMEQTSWIPEKFATEGKVLKLKDGDGNWEDGWIVKTAGTHRLEEKMLPDYHDEIKGHRRATGDALPKN